MTLRNLISQASVVLFAAALTLTSCTKDENLVSDLVSSDLTETPKTVEQTVIGNWTAQSFSNKSGVTFNDRRGVSEKGGLFSIEVDGTIYTDFTWWILDESVYKNRKSLQISFGETENMKRSFEIMSYSDNQFSLKAGEISIVLRK